ncbi:MAG: outer membrane protein assembly factor BamA [Nitrospirota bacterium]
MLCWLAVATALPAVALAMDAVVGEVRVEGLHSVGQEELLYLLGIEEGKAVDEDSIRRGIKRAFIKGIFENITVERGEEAPGVITVRVRERDFVADVSVRGTEAVGAGFIEEQLGLEPGDEMRYDLVEQYRQAVLETLRLKGYHDAEASLEVERGRIPHRVELVITIDEGWPEYVREINVIGRPSSEVLPYIRTAESSVFDQFRLREDIRRLTEHYKKKDYLNPLVGPFTFSDGVLHFNVNPGDRLEINIEGNDSISEKKLARTMPFFDAGEVRDDLIDEAVARIVQAYHAGGYPNAQVATVMSREDDTVTLNFFVYEGTKVEVGDISLEGITVPEENLKQVLSLREGGAYNPDLLDRDAQAIGDFYNALGYINVSVSSPEVSIEDATASVTIRIDEGKQVTISDIKLEGVESMSLDAVEAAVEMEAGDPYNEVDISDARRSITSLYRVRGYLRANVGVRRDFIGDEQAALTFAVEEGPQLFFGKTIVRGNRDTRVVVIEREFVHGEGEPLDKKLLLEARQRIFRTGLFDDVSIDVTDRYDHRSDVLVSVEEGKAGTVEFGLGYGEYDRLRGFFDVSYRNFFGMNRQGAFRIEATSLLSRYIVRYNDPWFLGRRIPFRAYFIKEDREEINIDTGDTKYRVERYTGGIGVEKALSDRVKLDVLYEYSLTDTFDVAPDIIISKEDVGTLAVSSITPSLTFDTRDNPFDPRRGLYAGVSLKTASVVLLSETDFFKLVGFASVFKELAKPVVLAASVRGGMAQGMRDTTDLPLIERFFLGGRSTVRGFSQDDLGPKGSEGNPIGGNAFFLGNLEFRISVVKNWRIVAFFDTGQVWLDSKDADLTDLRYTAGLGLQYNTPVGPIRVDYGHKLDRRAGESSGEVHFSIGHAF